MIKRGCGITRRNQKPFIAVLAGLIGAEIMLIIPGVSDSTVAMVGAVAAVAGWSAVMYHNKA